MLNDILSFPHQVCRLPLEKSSGLHAFYTKTKLMYIIIWRVSIRHFKCCGCHGEEIHKLQSVSSLIAARKNLLVHDQISNFQKLCTFNFSCNSSNDTNCSSSPVSISLLLHTTPFMLLHPLPQTDTQKLINIFKDHHLG